MSQQSLRRRTLVRAIPAALALHPMLAQAQAQAFPSKPVRIITSFSAGSGPDAALRVVAEALGKIWKQPVLVDNKPGGNGFVAVAAARQAAPDGHTLVHLDNAQMTTHIYTFSRLPYVPLKDFEPIRMMLRSAFFVTVAANSPLKTLDDLFAAARTNPDKVNYGSWFTGSPGHLGGIKLTEMAQIKMQHIPYRDQPQMYAAVANGEITWAFGSAGSAGPLEQSGKLRFLAYSAPQRAPLYPRVPTMGEASRAAVGYTLDGWLGLFAPAGTPAPVLQKVNADVAAALALPEVVERYRTFGFEAPDIGLQKFADLIRGEQQRWGEVLAKNPVKLD